MAGRKKTRKKKPLVKGLKESKDKFSKLVHIVFNTNEKNRIMNPILHDRPDIVYYFHYEAKIHDQNMIFLKENIARIEKELPKCEIIQQGVSYVDYYEIIGNLAKIITDKRYDINTKFSVNLGTGSKMVAIATMDAQRLWNRFTLIYPFSFDYDPKRKEGAHTGQMIAATPPHFKFKTPDTLLIKALQILDWLIEHDDRWIKKGFAKYQTWRKLTYRFKLLEVKVNTDKRKQESSKIIQMHRAIVLKLTDTWKFIIKRRVGKGSEVSLTEAGKEFIRVYRNYDLGLNFDEVKKELEDQKEKDKQLTYQRE